MIVDQWGQPLRFAHGATKDSRRGAVYETPTKSIAQLIPRFDRLTLCSISRRLYLNFGVVRAAINQKADYSVGDAWLPSYDGATDKADGMSVAAFLRKNWLPYCDIRGGIYDWQTLLKLVSIAIDREADCFILKTENAEKTEPRLQFIDYHRVATVDASDNMILKKGEYAGYRIREGRIVDNYEKAMAYRVTDSEDVSLYTDYPAHSIIHALDVEWSEMGRGLPSTTAGIEDIKHCLQSTEYERIRQLIVSSIGMVEYNDTGAMPIDETQELFRDARDMGTKPVSEEGMTMKPYAGGQYIYMRANSGAKLETIKHETPGDMWENFQDRMIRMTVAGMKWSYSMVWKPAGQGTAERADIERARRAVIERQKILRYVAKECMTYAYAYFAARGDAPLLDEPSAWKFTCPPRLSIDDGREESAMRDGLKLGTRNIRDIQAAQGKDLEEFYRERAEDIAMRIRIKQQAESDYGVKIDDREMIMLTPNEMAEPKEEPTTNEDE